MLTIQNNKSPIILEKKAAIDGLPSGYDFNYVINTGKRCKFCKSEIRIQEIEAGSVACTEDFDFLHKECIDSQGLEMVFSKPGDRSSLLQLHWKKALPKSRPRGKQ